MTGLSTPARGLSCLDLSQYNAYIESMRLQEYPMLEGVTYLDHAGTTLASKTLVRRFADEMVRNVYGNPHSVSAASQSASTMVDNVRLAMLQYFGADPDAFDVVFVANATAGAKLVADAFRDHPDGFQYAYHWESHTSLVGLRELAQEHRCVESDEDAGRWIANTHKSLVREPLRLFSYPAQSNLTGRQLPLKWAAQLRTTQAESQQRVFSLLDAAALASTSPLSLSDAAAAPDFTVVSLYKMFGFPDLGALIVCKSSGEVLQYRRYFGGGTVDVVTCGAENWHVKKMETLHDRLEDGTLPIHSILALGIALDIHQKLYGGIENVARHTHSLARRARREMAALRHSNGRNVCIMRDAVSNGEAPDVWGPLIAFNIRHADGGWASNTDLERLAAVRNIHLRTGALCNPGGTARCLGLAPWEMKRNFSAGHRCGGEDDVMGGKPTGVIRISFGAMSTETDIDHFLSFLRDSFVESGYSLGCHRPQVQQAESSRLMHVERVVVYPIKSCAGWEVPSGLRWDVRERGLAWDREWCLLHRGSKVAMSQKRHPRMALFRPCIDIKAGVLRVESPQRPKDGKLRSKIEIPLSADPTCFETAATAVSSSGKVCGDWVEVQIYQAAEISAFFSDVLDVPCQLARCRAAADSRTLGRRARTNGLLQKTLLGSAGVETRSLPLEPQEERASILFSNESPLLLISQSSVNHLNREVEARGGQAKNANVFRANVVVAEAQSNASEEEQPYIEDTWKRVKIGGSYFKMLGACRRCQMICVDQTTGVKNGEPLTTLSRTRRIEGKILFGQHMCLANGGPGATIGVGDEVHPTQR